MAIPTDKKAEPPNAAAVLRRFVILKNLFVKALAIPPSPYLAQWMENWNEHECEEFTTQMQERFASQIRRLVETGLWEEMGQAERDFMQAGPTEIATQSLIDAQWLSEAAVCLLWALEYVAELPPYDQRSEPKLTNQLPKETLETLVAKAVLRPASAIQGQRDLAELWHWRSRTCQLQKSRQMPTDLGGGLTIDKLLAITSAKAAKNGAFSSPINEDFPVFGKAYRDLTDDEYSLATSIALERHRAFNWLCGYAPGNQWNETPTET